MWSIGSEVNTLKDQEEMKYFLKSLNLLNFDLFLSKFLGNSTPNISCVATAIYVHVLN